MAVAIECLNLLECLLGWLNLLLCVSRKFEHSSINLTTLIFYSWSNSLSYPVLCHQAELHSSISLIIQSFGELKFIG